MGLVNKGDLESKMFQSNIKSKEDLIETFLLALSDNIQPAMHTPERKNNIRLSKSIFDGGYLVSNFIGNEATEFDAFQYELDPDLLGIDLKNFSLPMFQLHSHEKHDLTECIRRAIGHSGVVDVVGSTFKTHQQRRGRKWSVVPKIDFDLAYYKDNNTWYHHRGSYCVDEKPVEYILPKLEEDKANWIKKERWTMNEAMKHKDAKRAIEELNRARSSYGNTPVFEQIESEIDKYSNEEITPKVVNGYKFPYLYDYSSVDKYAHRLNKKYSHFASNHLQSHISLYLEEYYKWHIYIKTIDNRLGFQLPFSFAELDSIYELREMPKTKTGKNKKIVGWVCGHTRKIKIKDEQGKEIGKKEIWIKRFLRGENKFKWNGVIVGIMPSKYDLMRHKGVKRKFDISKIK